VTTWSTLSPSLAEADTIVWAPDNFQPPGPAVRKWFEDWLARGDRTLIYIGRDYDAGPAYWSKVQPLAPANQAAEVAARLQDAQSKAALDRSELPIGADCEWFSTEPTTSRTVKSLTGTWSAGIDVQKAEIEIQSGVVPAARAEVLLASGDDVLVSQDDSAGPGSRLIVVANGSFLLNLPLVNHEHRKLAGKLIDSSGPPGSVVFLASGREDPQVLDKDPVAEAPTGVEAFTIWPINYVLLHLAVVGLLLVFARWPIFGLARSLAGEPLADFGRHVKALGELLKNTGDRAFAQARLKQYHQATGGETTERDVGWDEERVPPSESGTE
jgi:hypothetical protein